MHAEQLSYGQSCVCQQDLMLSHDIQVPDALCFAERVVLGDAEAGVGNTPKT
jgi:hypothetical protein